MLLSELNSDIVDSIEDSNHWIEVHNHRLKLLENDKDRKYSTYLSEIDQIGHDIALARWDRYLDDWVDDYNEEKHYLYLTIMRKTVYELASQWLDEHQNFDDLIKHGIENDLNGNQL